MKKILPIIFGITLALSVVVSVQAQDEGVQPVVQEAAGESVFKRMWDGFRSGIQWFGGVTMQTADFEVRAIQKTIVEPVAMSLLWIGNSFQDLVSEITGARKQVALRGSADMVPRISLETSLKNLDGADYTKYNPVTYDTRLTFTFFVPELLTAIFKFEGNVIDYLQDPPGGMTYKAYVDLNPKEYKLDPKKVFTYNFQGVTKSGTVLFTQEDLTSIKFYEDTFKLLPGRAYSNHAASTDPSDLCNTQLKVIHGDKALYEFTINTHRKIDIKASIAEKVVEAKSLGNGVYSIERVLFNSDWKDKKVIPVTIDVYDSENNILGSLGLFDFKKFLWYYHMEVTEEPTIKAVRLRTTKLPEGEGLVEAIRNIITKKEERKIINYNVKGDNMVFMEIETDMPIKTLEATFNNTLIVNTFEELGNNIYLMSFRVPKTFTDGPLGFSVAANNGAVVTSTIDRSIVTINQPSRLEHVEIRRKPYGSNTPIACVPATQETGTIDVTQSKTLQALEDFCAKTIPGSKVGWNFDPGANIQFKDGIKRGIYAEIEQQEPDSETAKDGDQVFVIAKTTKTLDKLPKITIGGVGAVVTQVGDHIYQGVTTIVSGIHTVENGTEIMFSVEAPELGEEFTKDKVVKGKVVFVGKAITPEVPTGIVLVHISKDPDKDFVTCAKGMRTLSAMMLQSMEEKAADVLCKNRKGEEYISSGVSTETLRAVAPEAIKPGETAYLRFSFSGKLKEIPAVAINGEQVVVQPKGKGQFIAKKRISENPNLRDSDFVTFIITYPNFLSVSETFDGSALALSIPVTTTTPIIVVQPTSSTEALVGTVSVGTKLFNDKNIKTKQVVTVEYDKPVDRTIRPIVSFSGNDSDITSEGGEWVDNEWVETFTMNDIGEINTVTVNANGAKTITGLTQVRSIPDTFIINTLNPKSIVDVTRKDTRDPKSPYEVSLVYNTTMGHDMETIPKLVFTNATCSGPTHSSWGTTQTGDTWRGEYVCTSNLETAVEVKVKVDPTLYSTADNLEIIGEGTFVIAPFIEEPIAEKPTISEIGFYSDNRVKSDVATEGDRIRVRFKSSKPLLSATVHFSTIRGGDAIEATYKDDGYYEASFKVLNDDVDGKVQGTINFVDEEDISGNTVTTYGQVHGVEVDLTIPKVTALAFDNVTNIFSFKSNVGLDEPNVSVNGLRPLVLVNGVLVPANVDEGSNNRYSVRVTLDPAALTYTFRVWNIESDKTGRKGKENSLVVSDQFRPTVDAEAGVLTFTTQSQNQIITLRYNEKMDKNTSPTITFIPDIWTLNTEEWSDGFTWRGIFDIVPGEYENPIDIKVSGGKDLSGNVPLDYVENELFVVNNTPPTSTITFDNLANISNTNKTKKVIVTYSKSMAVSNPVTIYPDIGFTEGNLKYVENSGFWSTNNTIWEGTFFLDINISPGSFNNVKAILRPYLTDTTNVNIEKSAMSVESFSINSNKPQLEDIEFTGPYGEYFGCKLDTIKMKLIFNTPMDQNTPPHIVTGPSTFEVISGTWLLDNNTEYTEYEATLKHTTSLATEKPIIIIGVSEAIGFSGNEMDLNKEHKFYVSRPGDVATEPYDGIPNGSRDIADVITLFKWWDETILPDWVVGCYDFTSYDFDEDTSYESVIEEQQPNEESDINDIKYFFLNKIVNPTRFPISQFDN